MSGYQSTDDEKDEFASYAESGYWPHTRISMIGRLKEEGNDDAWMEFVDLYGPLILRFCRRRLSANDAEEVAQIVLIRLFRGLQKFEYSKDRGRFGGWIGQITRREISRFQTKDANLPVAADLEDIDDPTIDGVCSEWDDDYQSWLVEVVMEKAQASVTAEQWELFQMTWGSNRSAKEIAAENGIAASKIHKARFVVGKWIKHHIHELTQDYISPDEFQSGSFPP